MKVKMRKDKDDIIGVEAFLDYVDRAKEESEQIIHEKHRTDPYRFSVTDLTFCPRASYYKKTVDEVPEPSLRARMRMTRGSIYDKIITGSLGEQAQVNVEYEADAGLKIVGRLDGLLEDDKGKYVFELKTIETGHFLQQTKKPTDSSLKQTMIYCAIKKINRAKIVFFAPSNVYEFDLTFTDEELLHALGEAISTAMGISLAMRGGSPPAKQDKGSWKCKDCMFRNKCWK